MHATKRAEIGVQLTRDGVAMRSGMTVYLFDPYDNGALKEAPVVEINQVGAEVRVGGSTLCYSRRALWANRERAEADGPPHEVYNYSKISLRVQPAEVQIAPQPFPHETKAMRL